MEDELPQLVLPKTQTLDEWMEIYRKKLADGTARPGVYSTNPLDSRTKRFIKWIFSSLKVTYDYR